MLRRTKIVATLGPASERPKTLRKMIRSGLDVARLNFSHGTADDHRERARQLREAAEECGRDVGLLGDLGDDPRAGLTEDAAGSTDVPFVFRNPRNARKLAAAEST